MNYKKIVLIFLFLPLLVVGQKIVNKDSIQDNIINFKFEIINIDTLVTYYTGGEQINPNYKITESTKIWAHIVFIELPNIVDSIQLKRKVETIMKDNKINKAYVFRDEYSSFLFRASSLNAAKLLEERKGYLGEFKTD